VTGLDVAALVVIGLAALGGFRRGLVLGLCSLAGLAVGAYAGAKITPDLLRGDTSFFPPVVTLGGAVVGAGIGQMLAIAGGQSLRRLFRFGLLRALDNVGGAVLGAATGIVFVWIVASVLLYTPGETRWRRAVLRSEIPGALTRALPPTRLLGALARIDPFQSLAGPEANVPPADGRLPADPQVRAASRSVVRVIGTACGLGVEGSGFIAAPGMVVTNAHVVAGVGTPYVDRRDERFRKAQIVAFDPRNDLAVLRVPGLRGRPLPLSAPERGVAVAVLGYPGNGPFVATPGRLGSTVSTFVRDAYGSFPVSRQVTALRAHIVPGNSGGPAVDGAGRVRAVIFARRAGSDGGFGVPVRFVLDALRSARAGEPVGSKCAES
jgi:S1-C subfamily serine protease